MQAAFQKLGHSLNEHMNPMLLRELRQGIRSKVFLGVFLLLQGGMIFSMLLAMAASLSPQDRSAMGPANFFFWLTVLGPLLLTLPLKGSVAISSEAKGGTLELLFLSRLTAWRTVWGKWAAIIGQAVLVVAALLPYSFMRYYLGGIDILAELGLLAQSLLLCGLVTAMMISMSAFSGGIIKGSVLLASLSWGLTWLLAQSTIRSTLFSAIFSQWYGPLAAMAFWSLLILFFLQLGAARIAPPAENYTMRKRLFGLVFLLGVPPLLKALGVPYEVGLTIAVIVSILLVLEALLEKTIPLRTLYHPPGRSALVNAVVRYFFSPGWCSGIFYLLLIWLVATLLLDPVLVALKRYLGGEPQRWLLLLNVSGVLLFPIALYGMFRKRSPCPPLLYFSVTMLMFLLVTLSLILGYTTGDDFNFIMAALPHGQVAAVLLNLTAANPAFDDLQLLTIAGGFSGICWIICILRAMQQFHAMSTGAVEQPPEEEDELHSAGRPGVA